MVNTEIRLIVMSAAKDEEAEVEWFYEDLQDLLGLTHTHTKMSFSS